MNLNKDDIKFIKIFAQHCNNGERIGKKNIKEYMGKNIHYTNMRLSIFIKLGIIKNVGSGLYTLRKFLQNKEEEDIIEKIKNMKPKNSILDDIIDNNMLHILKLAEEKRMISIPDIRNSIDVSEWKIKYYMYVLRITELLKRKQKGIYEVTDNAKKILQNKI